MHGHTALSARPVISRGGTRFFPRTDAPRPLPAAAGPRAGKGGGRPAAPRGTRGKSGRADPRGGRIRTRLAFPGGELAAVPAPKPGLGFPLPPSPTYLRREGGGGSAPAPPARRRPPRPSALPAAAARSLRHGPPPPPRSSQFGAAILSVSPPRRASRIWAAPGRPCAHGAPPAPSARAGKERRGEAGPGPAPAAGCPMVGPGGCTSRQYAAHNSGRKIEDQQPSWQQAPLSNGVHKKFRSAHSYSGT